MKFGEFYRVLEKNHYYVFTLKDVSLLFPEEKSTTIKQMLIRWSKKKYIFRLKKGLYELNYPENLNIPDFYIANKLYSPSYISGETALSYYSIIPDVAMSLTSVTPLSTRRFKNHHGLFLYRSIKKEFYFGYLLENLLGYRVLIAEPEKALLDYLYFKTLKRKKFDIESERLDSRRISRFDKKKLENYSKKMGLRIEKLLC